MQKPQPKRGASRVETPRRRRRLRRPLSCCPMGPLCWMRPLPRAGPPPPPPPGGEPPSPGCRLGRSRMHRDRALLVPPPRSPHSFSRYARSARASFSGLSAAHTSLRNHTTAAHRYHCTEYGRPLRADDTMGRSRAPGPRRVATTSQDTFERTILRLGFPGRRDAKCIHNSRRIWSRYCTNVCWGS